MRSPTLPRIVLGHNAFFGVDHLSTQRGAERAAHFSDSTNVLTIVRAAINEGAGGLMLSTHPRAVTICKAIRDDANISARLQVFPLLPYAQKYVTRANELGLVRVVTQTLAEASPRDKFGLGTDFLRTVFRRDPLDLVKALMRLELRMFKDLNTPVIFLHDAISDLLLALNMPKIFAVYRDVVHKRFAVEAGVATKNLPFLVQRFEEWGMDLPVVLTHVNKVGFHVNPSREASEIILRRSDVHVMAMGTLASGFLAPAEAYQYVNRFPSVKSIVVGASSEAHLKRTFQAILLESEKK